MSVCLNAAVSPYILVGLSPKFHYINPERDKDFMAPFPVFVLSDLASNQLVIGISPSCSVSSRRRNEISDCLDLTIIFSGRCYLEKYLIIMSAEIMKSRENILRNENWIKLYIRNFTYSIFYIISGERRGYRVLAIGALLSRKGHGNFVNEASQSQD